MRKGLVIGRKRHLRLGVGLGMAVVLIAACVPTTPTGPPPNTPVYANPPQLLDSFAVSAIRRGQPWRIFVEGSGPGGGMKDVWVAISVLGTGIRSNQSIPLSSQDQSHFAGYLELPTAGVRPLGGWENVRVELRIRDNAGLHSPVRAHEVLIGAAVNEPIPPKWDHAATHHLGTIQVDFDGGRERRWRKRRG